MTTYIAKEILSEVLVFKTNIQSDEELERVRDVLTLEKRITRWSIDRNDVDKVLRVESELLHPLTVMQLLHAAGFLCEELPD